MRRLRHALWPAGLALGLAAEWIGRPELVVLDAAAGLSLLGLGLAAWSRRPASRVGALMAASGFSWFLGTLWSPAVFLVRGPLAHLLLSYPRGRLSSRVGRTAVAAAYVYAAAYPVAANDYATIGYALGLGAVGVARYAASSGIERRARLVPLAASTAFGLVLISGAAARLAHAGSGRAALFAYDLVVLLIALGLFADFTWGRWSDAALTGLVVDLGEPATAGGLRVKLVRALGDPTLELGYWVPELECYVDEAGRPVELRAGGGGRAAVPVDEDGRRVAMLVHDAAVLDDPVLLAAVSSATRLAVSNVRLQADVRARVAEVAASRRRLVEASDEQRRRLELQLREGPERRLARVGDLLADAGEPLAEARAGLVAAQAGLRELARGMHPETLSKSGLRAAVGELSKRSPIPVQARVSASRFPPPVEATVYFVCSESLANVAKYAKASQVRIGIGRADGRLRVEVVDDGVGGADVSRGSGLRGLADRVEALGGRLDVESPRGGGTRVLAELPCD